MILTATRPILFEATPAGLESRTRGIGRVATQLLPALRRASDRDVVEIAVDRASSLGGGPVRTIPCGFLLRRLSAPWRQILFAPLLARMVDPGQILIQTEPCLLPHLGPDRHLVALLYDLIPLLEPQDYLKGIGWAHRRLLTRWQPDGWRHASRVVAISEEVRRTGIELIGLDARRIDVVYPGMDHSTASAAQDDTIGKPFFLHVGAIESRKNIRRLVAAFARAALPPECVLAFAGPMAPFRRGMLESWAAESGVSDRIRILGHVDDSRLRALYRDCLAFTFPSLHEGFGLPPLEAMMAGAPVLAARTSCMPEVLGEAAHWCDGRDESSLADGLTRLAASPELRSDLRRRGSVQAARYTWTSAGQSLARVLESLPSCTRP